MYKHISFSKAVITATVCIILLMTAGALYLWHGKEKELEAFYDKLRLAVHNGDISSQEYVRLTSLHEARLATKGMSSFEALQYLLSYNGISAPREYLKELADKALLEEPDNPEVLSAWAKRHRFKKEGPNPEREAAYEKILAMDDVPKKLRRETFGDIAGTVWYYKPEEAIRYMEAYRSMIRDEPADYLEQGYAYERLGVYDKAIEVYQDYHAQTGSFSALEYIKAIEAGTPYIPPIERHAAPEQDGAQTPSNIESTQPH